MWIAVSSLISAALFALFILIAMSLGIMASLAIVTSLCVAAVTGAIGLLIGVVAWLVERSERRRELELIHGR
jgi:hypothetical protein